MLNLAKVFCLLLVATATRALIPITPGSAQRLFDKKVNSTILELGRLHALALTYITATSISLESEIKRLNTKVQSHASQSNLLSGDNEASVNENDPNSHDVDEGLKTQVLADAREYLKLLNQRRDHLDDLLDRARGFVENKRSSAIECAHSYPKTILGGIQTVSCINKVPLFDGIPFYLFSGVKTAIEAKSITYDKETRDPTKNWRLLVRQCLVEVYDLDRRTFI